MPYQSDKQRRYMHAVHPDIAARWDAEIRAKKKTKVAKALQVRVVGHGFIDPLLPRAKAAQFRTSAGKTRKVRAREQKVISNAVRAENNDWWVRGPIPPLVQKYERVYKKMTPEHKLRQQKRLQALTSLTGGTLGLTALGALATKHPQAAAKLTTVGAGVGGTSAFNFASIQNKEAKMRGPKQNVYVVRNKKQIKNIKSGLEPVKKELGMDFGLDSVHQGTDVERISYNKVSKGWGADSAARAAKEAGRADKVRRLKAIEARGYMTKGDEAAHEHYLRAWRKFTNLQERSNSGRLISPMRSRSFAPLEHQLPGYGGRTGSNWEFNGNKRVRKDLVAKKFNAEAKRQKRLDRYATGASMAAAGLGGAAAYDAFMAARGVNRLHHAKVAGGLGLGALGLQLGSNRIRSYKNKGGASYRPLARRQVNY